MTLADWEACGADYARTMQETAGVLAEELAARGIAPFRGADGFTDSHQFALLAAPFGGGSVMASALERANLLAYGIGLPGPEVDGDTNGLRIGTPELARRGLTVADMPQLADFIARALTAGESGLAGRGSGADGADQGGAGGASGDPASALAAEVASWRAGFTGVHFTAG